MGRKTVQFKKSGVAAFKDLQPGDPIFTLSPYDLKILETMVYFVRPWKHEKNVSGEAVEVIFYKAVVDIEGIDIEKLKTVHKEMDIKVHQTLIVNGKHKLVITHTNAASIPVPMSTDKDLLMAWVRGEAI